MKILTSFYVREDGKKEYPCAECEYVAGDFYRNNINIKSNDYAHNIGFINICSIKRGIFFFASMPSEGLLTIIKIALNMSKTNSNLP